MPHFSLHIREETLDDDVEPKLIGALTDAVGAVYGPEFRRLVGVELIGVPQRRRAVGGVPTEDDVPIVTLEIRETALSLPQVPDAPARLVAAITDALVDVLGEAVREQTVVTIVGVPRGRSGTAGTLV
ncbi:hypothetical protein ABZ896_26440 [Streptomyces sp. NPDC047072]|uniref:tautomerase family protein n=1 Tax=Streptomyces sp. NPDC047072 TaxID=3154809 RepID=UPI0033E1965F